MSEDKSTADMSTIIYVAGPITDIEDYEIPFDLAQDRLEKEGWTVVNPASTGIIEGAEWHDYMRLAIRSLMGCGAIYMLRGWEESVGAKCEHALASLLKMEIYYEGR